MDIVVSFPGGKRINAQVEGFTVETDQPVSLGGQGAAPAPYDLFLGSLATCAAIYVLGFCQARNIPTDGLALVQHSEMDPGTKLASRVRIEITLPIGFPEKYKEAIVRAAEGCKVKRTMQAPPSFEVVAVEMPVRSVA